MNIFDKENCVNLILRLAKEKMFHEENSLRYGQLVYNIATDLYPEITILNGSKYDCFFDDKKVNIFLEQVYKIVKKE